MKIERLVVENLTWLKRKAHQYYSDDFDADDLASETIEKILRSKDKFDSRKSFRPWALTVMHNTYITQYNRRKCVPFTGMDDDYSYASPYMADQELALSHIFLTSSLFETQKQSYLIFNKIQYLK
ncbi:RNA polymerase sigma factor, partial [Muribaculaceae bacterium M3]|nr:RNA polymerase sigma factor [Muribaculaceae bacterium M3]